MNSRESYRYPTEKRNLIGTSLLFIGAALMIYVVVSCAAFQIRHPHLNSTQTLIHIDKVLLWKNIPTPIKVVEFTVHADSTETRSYTLSK